ncbi:MAG TPA: phenylalanine--tRNA ligase beta subunit-related protein, partial [Anaerolineales bacterium]|nr:phenylalanine--tRNA ligase beta subunit-related protein [Anaerolineales bacterium]
AYFTEQEAVLADIGDTPLSELEPLAAWRGAFRQFGVNPTKYRSAIEALLRRLTKKGDIPSINALVDIGNLVSIRHRVPVAMFDADRTGGEITVQLAQGDEPFTPLFEKEIEHPEPGEVIFVDGNGNVAARRWCWRQSDQSASRPDTQALIAVTEAHHPAARQAVQAAITDLRDLIAEYLGGEMVLSRVGEGQGTAQG